MCAVTGRPLVKCGGRPGRINDTKAFEECPWKGPHYGREQNMADGGYPACAHCVYPYYQERDEVEGEKRTKKDRLLRQAYDERRDRIAARCVKDGNAAKIRAWVGKSSKHAKKMPPYPKRRSSTASYRMIQASPSHRE